MAIDRPWSNRIVTHKLENQKKDTGTDERSRRRFLKVSRRLGLAVAFSPGEIANAFNSSKTKRRTS